MSVTTKPMTRRKFYAALRRLGFQKAQLQMTRMNLTYERIDETGDNPDVCVDIPRGHDTAFRIWTFGGEPGESVPYEGIYHKTSDRNPGWAYNVDPSDVGLSNMFEVCIALLTGEVYMRKGGN